MTPEPKKFMRIGTVPGYVFSMVSIRVSRQTIYNWIFHGKTNSQGTIEKLKAEKRAGGWYTCPDYIDKFLRSVG